MPCWEVRTVTLALEAADLDLLVAAIEEEFGVTVQRRGNVISASLPKYGQVTVRNGTITVTAGAEGAVNRVKQAYARKAVKTALARNGWRANQTAPNRIQAVRRW